MRYNECIQCHEAAPSGSNMCGDCLNSELEDAAVEIRALVTALRPLAALWLARTSAAAAGAVLSCDHLATAARLCAEYHVDPRVTTAAPPRESARRRKR